MGGSLDGTARRENVVESKADKNDTNNASEGFLIIMNDIKERNTCLHRIR